MVIIQTHFAPYIVFCEETILVALNKMNQNKIPFIFTVTEQGLLHGSMTGGDLRRWLTSTPQIDLTTPVSHIANRAVKSARIDAAPETVQALFSEAITVVPLVDEQHRLVAVALPGKPEFSIAGRVVCQNSPSYIIAEIGNNHQGDVGMARTLIDAAVAAGADCAKFQMRNMASLYRGGGKADDASEDLGSQYTLDLLARFNLSPDQLFGLFDYCLEKGITPLCTPWDAESVDLLDRWGMAAFKVASADMTNNPLLRHMAAKKKPLIVSTGMSSESEISACVELLRGVGTSFALLHCNSTYPTPFKDVNLTYIARLATLSGGVVGYSGHERGWHVPIAAVAMGARVIEKHLTLNRDLEGSDHKVSLLPGELQAMVSAIRELEESLGQAIVRQLSQGERINRETLAKSVVAALPIAEGQVIDRAMLAISSPGKGLQPNRLEELVGRTAQRSFAAGDFFFPSDVEKPIAKPRPYRFARPWGVPVRYHDFRNILSRSNMTLLEYHLSYKDMEIDLSRFFDEKRPLQYVVHAPELFSGDHVLDLCSPSATYRQRSIDELQRVIYITNALGTFHDKPHPTPIVTNVGGFSEDRLRPASERQALYDLVLESLGKLDTTGCEIIPQTMPPFPWHFGGQRFHNLFMDPGEIATFCAANRMRVCLDVSHSKLACNHFNWSFQDFLRAVGPHTAHLHIADASGVDGEGLQIGDGDMDFVALARDLNAHAPQASFIPEVWQGHKNDGEGFWFALEQLEAAFEGGSR
jgi:sialic acid synthase SpsE/sugar phosphate isomerase/epimerase